MSEPQQIFRLRLTFAKQGRLAMLSHLEVARALERTVRRAGLPYAVSQGFSPHMLIAFGAARRRRRDSRDRRRPSDALRFR